jgi:hypothetical protein
MGHLLEIVVFVLFLFSAYLLFSVRGIVSALFWMLVGNPLGVAWNALGLFCVVAFWYALLFPSFGQVKIIVGVSAWHLSGIAMIAWVIANATDLALRHRS